LPAWSTSLNSPSTSSGPLSRIVMVMAMDSPSDQKIGFR
jgi:hypothetical protein